MNARLCCLSIVAMMASLVSHSGAADNPGSQAPLSITLSIGATDWYLGEDMLFSVAVTNLSSGPLEVNMPDRRLPGGGAMSFTIMDGTGNRIDRFLGRSGENWRKILPGEGMSEPLWLKANLRFVTDGAVPGAWKAFVSYVHGLREVPARMDKLASIRSNEVTLNVEKLDPKNVTEIRETLIEQRWSDEPGVRDDPRNLRRFRVESGVLSRPGSERCLVIWSTRDKDEPLAWVRRLGPIADGARPVTEGQAGAARDDLSISSPTIHALISAPDGTAKLFIISASSGFDVADPIEFRDGKRRTLRQAPGGKVEVVEMK